MSRKVDTYRRLRALMLELGHDQTSLGKRTGMSRQQISDRMICKTPWTLEEVYKVCDALFIPIKDVKKFFPPNGVEIRTALMAMERWIPNCRQLRTILTADVIEKQSIHWIRFSREVRCGII